MSSEDDHVDLALAGYTAYLLKRRAVADYQMLDEFRNGVVFPDVA